MPAFFADDGSLCPRTSPALIPDALMSVGASRGPLAIRPRCCRYRPRQRCLDCRHQPLVICRSAGDGLALTLSAMLNSADR